jgi:hypothetical protein
MVFDIREILWFRSNVLDYLHDVYHISYVVKIERIYLWKLLDEGVRLFLMLETLLKNERQNLSCFS